MPPTDSLIDTISYEEEPCTGASGINVVVDVHVTSSYNSLSHSVSDIRNTVFCPRSMICVGFQFKKRHAVNREYKQPTRNKVLAIKYEQNT